MLGGFFESEHFMISMILRKHTLGTDFIVITIKTKVNNFVMMFGAKDIIC
jgi:hypothetical protein